MKVQASLTANARDAWVLLGPLYGRISPEDPYQQYDGSVGRASSTVRNTKVALSNISPRWPRARVLIALIPPLVTFVILWAGWELLRSYAWFLFVPALTISAAIGGLWGGLIATAVSTTLVWWFFVPPEQTFVKELRFAVPTAIFVITGAAIASIVARWMRANERWRRVSEERRIFAALVDNSSDFIGIADLTATPVYVNPAGRRMVALPPHTPIENTRIPEYYPSDQRALAQDVIAKAMVEQGHWQGETYLRNWQTDAAIPVSSTSFAIRDHETDALLGVGTITRDISELRRAREEAETAHQQLRSLFEGAPEGIFIADLHGRYTDVNAAGCGIVGYSREELVGMTIMNLIRPEDIARLERDKEQLLAGNAVVGEWLLRRKDGTYVPVEVSATILPDGRCQGFVRDITTHYQLANALRAKSADLDRAQSVAQIGSWRLDVQRNELRWSDETHRIFGVPIGTPTSYETFLGCVHPDDRLYVDRMWTAALGGAPYDIEHRLLVAGQVKWVREKAELEFDDRRSFLGGIGIVQDITDRKRLEAEVHQAQERIELALSGADLAAWDWNIETGDVLFNERWAEMRGYAADDLRLRVDSWNAGIHPEDLARVQQALDDHFAGRTAEYECEFRVQTKSGAWIWILDRGKVFARNARGEPIRMLGTVLDITTRKRADIELRRIEHEQRFLAEVGPVLASSLEYEKTLDRLAQLAVRELADLCIVIVSVEGDIRRLNLKLLRAVEPTSIIAVPLVVHGKVLGAIALVASASSSRLGPADLQLAQELARRAALAIESARLYAIAQRAIQVRDDVLGVVAHDLRNPLNAINLQADMLREHEGDEHKAGDAIQRSVGRMNRLIQDILDVTKIEAGQLAVEQQRVSTLQVLLDVVEAQRPLAEARKLAILLEVAPDVPEVWADRDRLLQICENLIGNALKFTKHGSVTVGAAPRDGDVLLWVRDTGTGIAAEALPHLFDRFWKADMDMHRGAGLGLAIVKGLVEAHGGQVWAESTPGSGSCFYFTIPKAPPIDAWQSAPTAAP